MTRDAAKRKVFALRDEIERLEQELRVTQAAMAEASRVAFPLYEFTLGVHHTLTEDGPLP